MKNYNHNGYVHTYYIDKILLISMGQEVTLEKTLSRIPSLVTCTTLRPSTYHFPWAMNAIVMVTSGRENSNL